MAGRAAKVWVGVLVAWLAPAFGVRVGAADPILPPTAPVVSIPPLPPDADPSLTPFQDSLPSSPVIVYQRPPVVPPAAQPPADPFQEPPLSPFLPTPPMTPEVYLPDGTRVDLPVSTRQLIRFSPRYGEYATKREPQGDGVDRYTITGGVIVNVVYPPSSAQPGQPPREVEFATDNAVAWVKNAKDKTPAAGLPTGPGGDGGRDMEVELYLAGNVVIRTLTVDAVGGRTVEQVFRAREAYYDVSAHRAIALDGDIELRTPLLTERVHFRGREIWQLGRNEWQAHESELSASKRPNDPSLTYTGRRATLTQQYGVRRNIFGRPFRDLRTGEPIYALERVVTHDQARVRYDDVPFLWFRRTRTDIDDPTGPLSGVSLGNSNLFGVQAYFTWNLFNLLAIRPPTGHRWLLHTDYLSDRGPALGTDYLYNGPNTFGLGGPHGGSFTTYWIRDRGFDQLGGRNIAQEPAPPELRGRLRWQHNQELYENGTTYLRILAQAAYYTDKNFFEQYYKYEFDSAPDQSTFVYLSGAAGNLGGSVLAQGSWERDWMTQTEWMPRADGYLIGQSLLRDRVNYSARGDIGYAGLRPAEIRPLPIVPTDVRVDTGRFHLNQQVSVPLDVGPFRLDPYGVLDVAHYTADVTGADRGRLYGAGGLAGSVTLSRLYPEIASEMFNLKGLYHKLTLGANYYVARSDTPYNQLPQLDRLNDENTDFVDRTTRPRQQTLYNPLIPTYIDQYGLVDGPAGVALSTSPIFDPQRYAIRRRVDNRYDTLDDLEVVQLEARNRWQTKRGFPGAEHVVDWLAADFSVSAFPDEQRDNFGERWAFLRYNVLWNIGDRTTVGTAGWFDPFDNGARYINVSGMFNRPDGTTFFGSYRHTDPINSRLLTAGLNYALSRRYFVNFTANYDFGTNESLSNTVSLARVGSDLTVLAGFTYNSILQNFGFQFALVPNAVGVTPAQLAYGNMFGTRRK